MQRFSSAYTKLNGAHNSSTTTIAVDSVVQMPSSGDFRIQIDDEIMYVTAVNAGANQVTVVRGSDGTTAASHSDDADVKTVVTPSSIAEVLHQSAETGNPSAALTGGSTAEGDYSVAGGNIGRARGLCSTVLGLQCEAWGSHSIAFGEDTRTGDRSTADPFDQSNAYGQAALAGNHFCRVNGRASTTFGCNNCIPDGSSRSLAIGYCARPFRNTQFAMASGGFVDPNDPYNAQHAFNAPTGEGLHIAHTKWTGHAQTNLMIFRGETLGAAAEETAGLGVNAYAALGFGPSGEWTLELEDKKAYHLKAEIVQVGYVSGVLKYRRVMAEAVVYRNGANATIKDQTATPDVLGDSTPWTFAFATYGSGVYLLVTTGANNTSKMRCAARLEFTEVLFPEEFPENETWETDLLDEDFPLE